MSDRHPDPNPFLFRIPLWSSMWQSMEERVAETRERIERCYPLYRITEMERMPLAGDATQYRVTMERRA